MSEHNVISYINALQELINTQKSNALLAGAPLVALTSQLKWINSVDDFVLNILVSISVICFLIGGGISMYLIEVLRDYTAKAHLYNAGEDLLGSPLISAIENNYRNTIVELNERNILSHLRKFSPFMIGSVAAGWGALIAIIFMSIWSAPVTS